MIWTEAQVIRFGIRGATRTRRTLSLPKTPSVVDLHKTEPQIQSLGSF